MNQMKYLHIGMLLLLSNLTYAQKQSVEDLTLIAWQNLLDENRISQLEFNQVKAKMDYQKRQNALLQSLTVIENRESIMGGTASISGTVESSSSAVENIVVTLCQSNVYNCFFAVATDQFGAYSFQNLSSGDYLIVTNDSYDAYINAIWSSSGTESCFNCQPDADNQVTLSAAENRTGVDLDVVLGASVSGQVTESAAAVDSQYVNIQTVGNQNYYGNGYSDGSGNYTISGLPAGDYYLTLQNPEDIYIDAMWSSTGTVQCYNCIVDANSTLSLSAAEVRTGIDFALTIGATLEGDIYDENTLDEVNTFSVQLYDTTESGDYWYHWTTYDGFGTYTVQGIPAGNYKVYLEPTDDNMYIPEIYNNVQCNACASLIYNGSGDALNLVNGATTSGISFALEVGASVSGFIVDNNDIFLPLTQFGLIYLFNDSNRLLASRIVYGSDYEPLANGAYTLGGLLPGMYFAQGGDVGRQFYQRELYENKHCPWSGCDRGGGGTPVVLGDGEQRLGINFLLNYGGKIAGTVNGITYDPQVTTYVQFYDNTGAVAGGAGINPDGTYTSQRALPPGTYSVRTGSMFNGQFIDPLVMQKYAPGGNIDCPGVTCDLTAGNVTVSAYNPLDPTPAASATVTGIDFNLTPGFSFTGNITEIGSADPIPDVHVLVYNSNGDFANWATTDASGNFTVYGLPAGTYFALTNNGSNLPFMGVNQTEAGGWIDILFDGTPCPGSACDVTTGDPIVLGPVIAGPNNPTGTVSSYNFGMNAGGTITGQIRNASNQLPAGGVQVNVYNSNGDFYGSYESDDNGYYMTVGFPSGTYYLTTTNNGALIDAKYGGGYCENETCNPLDATPVVIVSDEAVAGVDFDLKPDYIFKAGFE
jgi:hypothetical protein